MGLKQRESNPNFKKILVADSCAGGSATLCNIICQFPDSDITYLCDGEKNPFGLKSKQEIQDIVIDWLYYAKHINAKLLVIACNTASIAVHELRDILAKRFDINIVTMLDAAQTALALNTEHIFNKRVALFGTNFTINSQVLSAEISKFSPSTIIQIVGTSAERYVARNLFNIKSETDIVYHELMPLKDNKADTIVLACTCFEFVRDIIEQIRNNINIININDYICMSVDPKIVQYSKCRPTDAANIHFVTTGNLDVWSVNLNVITSIVFKNNVKVEKVYIHK